MKSFLVHKVLSDVARCPQALTIPLQLDRLGANESTFWNYKFLKKLFRQGDGVQFLPFSKMTILMHPSK